MRLKIATAFALLILAALAIALVRLSSVMPEKAGKRTPSAPSFEFSAQQVSGSKALSILSDFLKISPRNSATPGAQQAAEFIFNTLDSTGLKVSKDEFSDKAPGGELIFRNVTATAAGNSSNCIVLISHYDTKSRISDTFTGANDSGSSTALLLHLAEIFARSTSSVPDIVMAFVDGEECIEEYSENDGLHGSRRLVSKLAADYGVHNIKAAVVLDMIGDRSLSITLPRNSTPELAAQLFSAAEAEGKRHLFSLSNPILDDHVPFLEAGIPAIDIIDFQYGSTPKANDYWHTDQDTIDKISAESLETVGRITVRLVNSIIASSGINPEADK